MNDRKHLDAIEAKHGLERPGYHAIEQSFRALVAEPNDFGTTYEAARLIVDQADVADRHAARKKLYQQSKVLLKEAFEFEGREAFVDVKGQNLPCIGGWRCSRKARSKLTLPDGTIAAACFQHEEDMLGKYAGQKLAKIFPPDDPVDDGDGWMIDSRTERHESMEPGTYKEFGTNEVRPQATVTVADVWARLAERVRRVNQSIPSGSHRDAFLKLVESFEAKWGQAG